MILLLDNYDSFTYNLAQFLGQLGGKLEVHRNDRITLDQITAKKPERIVISPGPGTPEDSGICVDVIKRFAGQIPILGVCLGHQAIGYAFGGKVIRAPEIMHGKTSRIHHDNKTVFKDLPQDFVATRYHSLIVEEKSFPGDLEIFREDRRHHHGPAPPDRCAWKACNSIPNPCSPDVGMQPRRIFFRFRFCGRAHSCSSLWGNLVGVSKRENPQGTEAGRVLLATSE